MSIKSDVGDGREVLVSMSMNLISYHLGIKITVKIRTRQS